MKTHYNSMYASVYLVLSMYVCVYMSICLHQIIYIEEEQFLELNMRGSHNHQQLHFLDLSIQGRVVSPLAHHLTFQYPKQHLLNAPQEHSNAHPSSRSIGCCRRSTRLAPAIRKSSCSRSICVLVGEQWRTSCSGVNSLFAD